MASTLTIKGHTFGAGRPIICLPVVKKDRSSILAEMERLVEMKAEAIEWRVDAFDEATNLNAIRSLLEEMRGIVAETPLVYTFRSKKQGGLLELDEELVADIREVGAETGVPDFIDMEFFCSEHPERVIRDLQKMNMRVIASHHDFDQTPEFEVLRQIMVEMDGCGADIVKLAVMPNTAEDVLALLGATNAFREVSDTLAITMSMGKIGMISRVCGEIFGSCMTFGTAGDASAPGQIERNQLQSMMDILSLREA